MPIISKTLDTALITLISASFLIAGISKGAAGIGQMTVALAILSNVMGLRELIPLMVNPGARYQKKAF